jgi:Amt family ammonium transporter
LITGAIADRMKFSAWFWFVGLWSLLVYTPVAHWVFSPMGWLFKRGALDFAGGTVVHVNAGIAALAVVLVIGKRKGWPGHPTPPHSLPLTLLGTGILWFGWFGFNAGSALGANGLAANAFVVTHLAAAVGGLSWAAAEWVHQKRPTTLGAASGVVAGLVAITPASGFVGPMSAILIGAVAGVVCYLGVLMKWRLGYDDSLDVVGVHGVGGIFGALATGLLAQKLINAAGADGAFFGDPVLVLKQVVAVLAVVVWSFGLSYALLRAIQAVMGLRVDADDEELGLDLSQHNETAYSFGSSTGRMQHHEDSPAALPRRVEPSAAG